MTLAALHTEILDRKLVGNAQVILEHSKNFPKEKSNVYAVKNNGELIWFAELPSTGDLYSNSVHWDKSINENAKNWNDFYVDNLNTFCVSSWNGWTVSISYETGKIIQSEFTK